VGLCFFELDYGALDPVHRAERGLQLVPAIVNGHAPTAADGTPRWVVRLRAAMLSPARWSGDDRSAHRIDVNELARTAARWAEQEVASGMTRRSAAAEAEHGVHCCRFNALDRLG
jgi:hypothetical protein